jgi:hypothetical protein
MKPAIADVMIHVDETLPEYEMADVADAVCSVDGVASGCLSMSAGHLIMVRYDADSTTAHVVLETVRHRGLHAELVGF